MNLDRFIDRVGDWNPQLFRELKGRFTTSSMTFISLTSGSIQVLGGLWLVNGSLSEFRFYTGFKLLNWLLPMVLILGGIYTLISDLNSEKKRGTFDFIKSSPQPGRSILLGKLIGVPSLVYLAVLSLVPLHIIVAVASGASLGLLLAWYLTIGASAYLCLSLTIMYVIYGGKHAILFALLTSQPISTAIAIYDRYLTSTISDFKMGSDYSLMWFYLPVVNNAWLFYSFTCCTILFFCYWLWIAIDRKYIHLTTTSLKKEHNYWMNIILQLWLLGFALPLATSASDDWQFYTLTIFYTIGTAWIACSIVTILPNRQSMQEWSQYWQEKFSDRHQFNWRHPDLVQELIWHDRSPAILSMLINLSLSAIVWGISAIGLFVFFPNINLLGQFIIGIAIASIVTLIYVLLIHLLCLRSNLQNNNGVVPLMFLMSFLPCLCGGLLIGIGSQTSPIYKEIACILLLFSPLFGVAIGQLYLPLIGLTALGQIGILSKSIEIFQKQLLIVGALRIDSNRQKFIIERTNAPT